MSLLSWNACTYKLNGPSSPRRDTDEDDHIDDCSQAHGKSAEKERLCWVADHGEPDIRIDDVTQDR